MNHKNIISLCIIVGLALLGCMEEDLSLEFSGNECSDDSNCKDYEECQGGQCVLAVEYTDGDKAADDSDGDSENANVDMDEDSREAEAIDGDDDNIGSVCVPESFRCRGIREVERCKIDGSDWVFYRSCEADDICLNGTCEKVVDGDEDAWEIEDTENADCQGTCDPAQNFEFCLADNNKLLCRCNPKTSQWEALDCDFECKYFANKFGRCKDGYDITEFERGFCSCFSCFSDEDCSGDFVCNENGKCVKDDAEDGDENACISDEDCEETQWCYTHIGDTQGLCVDKCVNDEDCALGLICNHEGFCVAGSLGDCGGSCPPGYFCDPIYNQCVLNCPPCPENQCCDADSAPNCYDCICENPFVCGPMMPHCCYGYHCSIYAYGPVGVCMPD